MRRSCGVPHDSDNPPALSVPHGTMVRYYKPPRRRQPSGGVANLREQVDMADLTHHRCTVQRHGGDFCDAPSAEDVPFPICERHAARLYRHIAASVRGLASDPLLMAHGELERIKDEQAKDERRWAAEKPVVYYVQVGEFIKIGVTTRLRQRLQAYPPNKRLLATEPGNYALESKRHEQFEHLLAHGHEWFRCDAKLIDHINDLRKAAGATPIAWQAGVID